MLLYYVVEWRIRHVGFLSINDEILFDDHWQEIEKENRAKLLYREDHHQFNNSANSCLNGTTENGKEKRRPLSKLFIDEVETVV